MPYSPSGIRALFGLYSPMKRMGIYAIKHTASGRVYIGSSADLKRRQREHWRDLERGKHYNVYLQRCWRNYGPEAFTFTVVEEVSTSDLLLVREQFHIDACGSALSSKGFNLSPVAGSTLGTKRSPETRALQSRIKLGTKRPPEDCAKISRAQLGIKRSAEQRQRMSEAQRRPEVRAQRSAARKAFELTPEGRAQRQRLTDINSARSWTAEEREAIRVRTTGVKASESAKAAMREASRRYWDSPAGKISAAERVALRRERHRQKQAVA